MTDTIVSPSYASVVLTWTNCRGSSSRLKKGSESEMNADVYWIDGPWRGRLAIVPRPRGADWLDDDVRAWHNAGIHIVVSLLTPQEAAELDIEREAEHVRRRGMMFLTLPIPDRGVPDTWEQVSALVFDLDAALHRGSNVAVHCRQGIGRSALLAASLLVHAGTPVNEAFDLVQAARGCPVPDTDEQRQWVEGFGSRAPALQQPAVVRSH